ncbi:hypothetical protein NIES267_39290 [Calothrix parasitica NIES-267]|uniref:Uncharacterized protein n=1 Tax=Calothrix parasitica NIES-267 TaxID=1973488 RepID=A0A1Z4LT64_9CYAN|nr:hypothetical protein NIES267_39290 [Calothrix parasitica NIES-267]
MNEPRKLVITDLAKGLPAITPSFGAALAEACAVCLEEQKHSQGVEITVNGDFDAKFELSWQPVTEQMLRCWNDEEFTTEQAAYGIAFLIVRELTDLTVIERSRKGTGFDYWLGTTTDVDEGQPFKNKVRLEVSGIRKGDSSRVKARIKQKKEQTEVSDGEFPAYIIIVEFSTPLSYVECK